MVLSWQPWRLKNSFWLQCRDTESWSLLIILWKTTNTSDRALEQILLPLFSPLLLRLPVNIFRNEYNDTFTPVQSNHGFILQISQSLKDKIQLTSLDFSQFIIPWYSLSRNKAYTQSSGAGSLPIKCKGPNHMFFS